MKMEEVFEIEETHLLKARLLGFHIQTGKHCIEERHRSIVLKALDSRLFCFGWVFFGFQR